MRPWLLLIPMLLVAGCTAMQQDLEAPLFPHEEAEEQAPTLQHLGFEGHITAGSGMPRIYRDVTYSGEIEKLVSVPENTELLVVWANRTSGPETSQITFAAGVAGQGPFHEPPWMPLTHSRSLSIENPEPGQWIVGLYLIGAAVDTGFRVEILLRS